MSNIQHQFKPLAKPKIIPVHWALGQDEYKKLHNSDEESRNHWRCFMENNLFHIYKGLGGIEHYRFALHKQTNGSYLVNEIETHDNSNFYETAELNGWTKAEVEEHKVTFAANTAQEVVSILSDYFDLHIDIPQ